MRVVIEAHNSYSQMPPESLAVLPKAAIASIDKQTSYYVNGYYMTEAFKAKRWDGRHHLFRNGIFPTGLMAVVLAELKKVNVAAKIEDFRKKPSQKISGIKFTGRNASGKKIEIRPYQQEARDAAVEIHRGIINHATGAGKTVTAAMLIEALKVPTLFVVNGAESMYQTAAELEALLGVKCGLYGDGVKTPNAPIVVGLIPSLIRQKKDAFTNYGLLIVDECHHSAAETWYKYIMQTDIYYRFGFTGTAFRSDDSTIMLRAALGRVIHAKSAVDLGEDGYLVKPKIKFLTVSSPRVLATSYTAAYEMGIVNHETRTNLLVETVKKSPDLIKLIIVERLSHAKIIEAALKEAGVETVLVTGLSVYRKSTMAAFKGGEIRTLIATRIYDESVDVPALDMVILAAGMKSKGKMVQRIGRCLRPSKGKTEALVIDFYDRTNFILERQSALRIEACRASGFEVEYENPPVSSVFL